MEIPSTNQLNELSKDFSFSDEANNEFELVGNQIFLQPNKYLRRRNIGSLYVKDNRLIYTKRDSNKAIFRKLNAWSFSYDITKKVYGVMIISEDKVYKILASKALKVGQILYFKSSTEKKIYVPLSEFYVSPLKKYSNA